MNIDRELIWSLSQLNSFILKSYHGHTNCSSRSTNTISTTKKTKFQVFFLGMVDWGGKRGGLGGTNTISTPKPKFQGFFLVLVDWGGKRGGKRRGGKRGGLEGTEGGDVALYSLGISSKKCCSRVFDARTEKASTSL